MREPPEAAVDGEGAIAPTMEDSGIHNDASNS